MHADTDKSPPPTIYVSTYTYMYNHVATKCTEHTRRKAESGICAPVYITHVKSSCRIVSRAIPVHPHWCETSPTTRTDQSSIYGMYTYTYMPQSLPPPSHTQARAHSCVTREVATCCACAPDSLCIVYKNIVGCIQTCMHICLFNYIRFAKACIRIYVYHGKYK